VTDRNHTSATRIDTGLSAWAIAMAAGTAALGCGSDPVDMTRTNAIGETRLALAAGADSRAEEVASYLEEHYFNRFTVLATTQGPYGGDGGLGRPARNRSRPRKRFAATR
jgi:hypothetical protein